MSAEPRPPRPEDQLAAESAALEAAVAAALGPWVREAVRRRVEERSGAPPPPAVVAAADEAARRAELEVLPRLAALLAADVDDQASTPLAVLRSAVAYPTAVLAEAGVPPVVRDELAERVFPDDVYDLTPGSFADLSPALAEPGLRWGAAKAFVVLRRRRAEGGPGGPGGRS